MWAALALHAKHPVVSPPPKGKVTIANIRVFAGSSFAKVGGTVHNTTDRAVGASISCSLRDAAGKTVGTANGGIPFIRPHGASPDQTIASGPTEGSATAAKCNAQVIAPTPPPQPVPPKFQPASVAFFDAQRGILVDQTPIGQPGVVVHAH